MTLDTTEAARTALSPLGLVVRGGPASPPGGSAESRLTGGAPDTSAPPAGLHGDSEAAAVARLRAALDGWQAAPYYTELERDAAGEMWAAGAALLEHLELREAAEAA